MPVRLFRVLLVDDLYTVPCPTASLSPVGHHRSIIRPPVQFLGTLSSAHDLSPFRALCPVTLNLWPPFPVLIESLFSFRSFISSLRAAHDLYDSPICIILRRLIIYDSLVVGLSLTCHPPLSSPFLFFSLTPPPPPSPPLTRAPNIPPNQTVPPSLSPLSSLSLFGDFEHSFLSFWPLKKTDKKHYTLTPARIGVSRNSIGEGTHVGCY